MWTGNFGYKIIESGNIVNIFNVVLAMQPYFTYYAQREGYNFDCRIMIKTVYMFSI